MLNELNMDELMAIDGGDTFSNIDRAIAIVTLVTAVGVGAFCAGRQFVKDIRNKFFN